MNYLVLKLEIHVSRFVLKSTSIKVQIYYNIHLFF